MMKSMLMLALVGLLTACADAGPLDTLKTTKPTGDAYQQSLAADYRDLAEEKASHDDWADANYFADKGLMAAYGRDIQPEDPAQWNIGKAPSPELDTARTQLLAAVRENRTIQPEMSASATVAYDRWLDAVKNRRGDSAISEQHELFAAVLSKLTEAHTATVPNLPTTTTPKESKSAVLYFPFDSDRAGDSAQAALAELVRYVKGAGKVTVTINGHTDRAGTEEYNMDLSARRARFVLGLLKADGIPASLMNYFAFGESDPAVPTADGVREPKNRRVEIYVE